MSVAPFPARRSATGADPRDRLIVALDVPDGASAMAMAGRLGDSVTFYKIGLGMLTTGGLAAAMELKDQGKKVFLDMKLFDIPATIEHAVRRLAAFDLDFLTVHGDPSVVRAAAAGAAGTKMKILGVTVLTSSDRGDLDAALIRAGEVSELVAERAARAWEAGADGVIASAQEAAALRALPESAGKLIVTPGIRPTGASVDDQKRISTPGAAVGAGADHIVVGRPVWQADDPAAAARAIQAELP